jgi:hypothetical protein
VLPGFLSVTEAHTRYSKEKTMADWDSYDEDDIKLVDPPATDKMADQFTGREPTVDEMISAYEHYEQAEKAARNSRLQIVAALAARVPQTDGSKTVRLRGDRRRVKIELPADAWEQGRLKQAWFAYPQYAQEFMKINTLSVRLREWKKALRESGPADFQMFISMLKDANRGPIGTPRIIIES